jgi:hypothetical protein
VTKSGALLLAFIGGEIVVDIYFSQIGILSSVGWGILAGLQSILFGIFMLALSELRFARSVLRQFDPP